MLGRDRERYQEFVGLNRPAWSVGSGALGSLAQLAGLPAPSGGSGGPLERRAPPQWPQNPDFPTPGGPWEELPPGMPLPEPGGPPFDRNLSAMAQQRRRPMPQAGVRYPQPMTASRTPMDLFSMAAPYLRRSSPEPIGRQ